MHYLFITEDIVYIVANIIADLIMDNKYIDIIIIIIISSVSFRINISLLEKANSN